MSEPIKINEKLLRFGEFLATQPEEIFDYSKLVSEYRRDLHGNICGTVCCAAGALPFFDPSTWVWRSSVNIGVTPDNIYVGLATEDPGAPAMYASWGLMIMRLREQLAAYFELSPGQVQSLFFFAPIRELGELYGDLPQPTKAQFLRVLRQVAEPPPHLDAPGVEDRWLTYEWRRAYGLSVFTR